MKASVRDVGNTAVHHLSLVNADVKHMISYSSFETRVKNRTSTPAYMRVISDRNTLLGP